ATKKSPSGGAGGLVRTSGSSASSRCMSLNGRRPRPISTIVPTSILTMWWRNRSAAISKSWPLPSGRSVQVPLRIRHRLCARGVHPDRLGPEPRERPLDLALDGALLHLSLPAGEPSAVVVERDQEGARHRGAI